MSFSLAEFPRHYHQENFDSFLGVSSVERKSLLLAQYIETNLNSFNQLDGKPKLFIFFSCDSCSRQLKGRDEIMMSPPLRPIKTEGNRKKKRIRQNWSLPIGAFQGQFKQTMTNQCSSKHN